MVTSISFLGQSTFSKKAKNVGWFSFAEELVPVGVPLSKKFRRGEVGCREPFPFPLDSRLVFGSCVIPHLSPREHGHHVVHCTQSPQFLFPLPLDLLLAAVAPEAGCSSCLAREEKCFSRFFSSKYRTAIFVESGVVSRFTSVNSIFNAQRQRLAVLTVEADGVQIIRNFLVRLLLQCDSGFNPPRVERIKISSVSKTDSSVSLTLKCTQVIHATSSEKAFYFLYRCFFNEDSSFAVSVDDLLETTRCLRIKNKEVCVQLGPGGSM